MLVAGGQLAGCHDALGELRWQELVVTRIVHVEELKSGSLLASVNLAHRWRHFLTRVLRPKSLKFKYLPIVGRFCAAILLGIAAHVSITHVHCWALMLLRLSRKVFWVLLEMAFLGDLEAGHRFGCTGALDAAFANSGSLGPDLL
jgi:hypothetical protein